LIAASSHHQTLCPQMDEALPMHHAQQPSLITPKGGSRADDVHTWQGFDCFSQPAGDVQSTQPGVLADTGVRTRLYPQMPTQNRLIVNERDPHAEAGGLAGGTETGRATPNHGHIRVLVLMIIASF